MNEEAILELYNELSTDYEVGDIDQFKAYLQDPESRVDFFEQIIKPIYAVEDIADFEAFYGLKKKRRYGIRIGRWFFGAYPIVS